MSRLLSSRRARVLLHVLTSRRILLFLFLLFLFLLFLFLLELVLYHTVRRATRQHATKIICQRYRARSIRQQCSGLLILSLTLLCLR